MSEPKIGDYVECHCRMNTRSWSGYVEQIRERHGRTEYLVPGNPWARKGLAKVVIDPESLEIAKKELREAALARKKAEVTAGKITVSGIRQVSTGIGTGRRQPSIGGD